MPILSYFTRFTMKRGNAGSWNSGWKRSKRWKPILHCSKSPETPRNNLLELIRISERKKYTRGPTPCPGDRGRASYRAPPISWAPWWASGVHLLLYHHFYPGKNRGQAYGTKLHRHEAEPWRNQSRALTKLFCWGHFPPGGGNHHQRSSHRERVNLHQHLHQHHLLSNPSSSLVSNLVSKTTNCYMWVASSVDYSL